MKTSLILTVGDRPLYLHGQRTPLGIRVLSGGKQLALLPDSGGPLAPQIHSWVGERDKAELHYYGVAHRDWLIDMLEAS